MSRINKVDYFASLSILISLRGTCRRRKVGCVLVSEHGDIIGTGYNGPARNQPHCTSTPCAGAEAPSGEGLDKCEAIHAETNALLQCSDVYNINTCFTTTAPCIHCVKALLNTSCEIIVFLEDYPHSDSKRLWEQAGRSWVHLNGLEFPNVEVAGYELNLTTVGVK